jgi:type II secretory pathway component PulJ
VTGQETFELAAAIAGVCIGLAALVIFSLVAIIGAWQVFRRASEASTAATKASQGAEELARHLAFQAAGPPRGESGQLTEVRQEAAALLDKLRELAESGALEGGPSVAALSQLEASVGRLDATVGQMAASLANLVQLWEQQRR